MTHVLQQTGSKHLNKQVSRKPIRKDDSTLLEAKQLSGRTTTVRESQKERQLQQESNQKNFKQLNHKNKEDENRKKQEKLDRAVAAIKPQAEQLPSYFGSS